MTTETGMRADVVIVGGGGSGLAAAIGAAESGAKVLLLEKNNELGGTTRLSIGSVTATGTALQKKAGITDTPDEHFEDMGKFAGELAPRDNLELRRILVDNVPDTVAWLVSLGITFFGPMPEPPHRKPRMHNILPNSRAYIYYLSREARRLGVDIRLNARAVDVLLGGGKVAELKTILDGREATVRTSSVIFASGDFTASRDLKGEFAPRHANTDAINPASTGDGQAIMRRVGATIRNGDLFVTQLRFVQPPDKGLLLKLPPSRILTSAMLAAMRFAPAALLRPFILSFVTTYLAPEAALFKEGAILVNRAGKRFADERLQPAFEVPAQPEKSAYIILDRTLAEKFSAWPHFVSTAPGVAYAYVPDYKHTRKDIYHEADTIAGLAASLKISAPTLEATMKAYNDGTGSYPRESRPRLDEPRFVALGPVCNWVVLGEGGVAVTSRHEVTGEKGAVIPGLYAAGSSGQGGLLLEGHGHHLGWAFTSGRRAGRNAAAYASGNRQVTAA